MTSYIPKYQLSAILKRREGNSVVSFKYQKMRKDGSWGAVRDGDNRYCHKATPQEVLDKWEKLNPGSKYRLA